MNKLPLAPMGRILADAGAQRSTKNAKIELSECLAEIGHEIAEKSVKIAEHSGRKTVKAEDIELALKMKF